MHLDFVQATTTSPEVRSRDAARHLQNLFSDFLSQAGRDGFASAQPLAAEPTEPEDIRSGWSEWFDAVRFGQYRSMPDAAQLKQAYGEILVRAWHGQGLVDPHGFLTGLTDEELHVVQLTHHLADPIDRSALTEEGALNLLIPPPATVDVNGDGLTQIGIGYALRFPDSRTPPEVVRAWNEVTEGMPFGDRACHELRMKMPLLLANLKVDANGSFVRQVEPGDPDFVNPMADSNYSYRAVTRQWLESLERFRYQMRPDQYESQRQFWTAFQEALERAGAH